MTWEWSAFSDLYHARFPEEYRTYWLEVGPCRLARRMPGVAYYKIQRG